MSLIHICVGFDDNFYDPFCALLQSIIEHHNPGEVHVHAISPINQEKKNRILNYARKHLNMDFHEINETPLTEFITWGRWTTSVYYRVFFPSILKDTAERLIYLDCDTIVVNNLNPLFNIDLQSNIVGAVYDNYVKEQKEIGIEEGNYFNSGVILIDVKKWNEQGISEKTADYLIKYPEKIKFVDQCALNAVLRGHWLALSSEYNFLYSYLPENFPSKKLKQFIKDKVVIHFTLQRPWNLTCRNIMRRYYKKYLYRSPIRSGKAFYQDFSQKNSLIFLKIRLLEFYFNSSVLIRINRILKRSINRLLG